MKNLCKLTLAAGVLLGAARLADLIFFTSAETGFVTVGGPLMRYIAFVLAAVLALAAGAAVPAAASPRAATAKTAPLWWALGVAGLWQGLWMMARAVAGADLPDAAHTTPLRSILTQAAGLLCGNLFLVWAVFCALLALRLRGRQALGGGLLLAGVAGSAALYVYTILRFVTRPASWHRLLAAVDVLGVLSALLLTAALLRALFLPDSPGAAKGLVRMGLLAFVFGTCLALPQGIWQVAVGREGLGSLGLALFCGAAGALGAVSAWRVADRGKPPAGSPEEKA